MRRGQVQNGGDFAHLHQKSGPAARQIVRSADAREDAIGDGQAGLLGGHERAHLRQQHDQRGLAQVGGLAAHVGAGDEQDLVRGGVEVERVGHEALALLFEQMFDDRMAAAEDDEFAGVGELGAHVVARGGERGEVGQHVELRDGGGGAAQARRLLRDPGAHFGEEAALDFGDALVGGEDFAFVLLQLGRGEALGVDQRLLALEIGGREMQVGLGNFEIEAEDLVVANLQRADAGALAFAVFHGGDGLAAGAGSGRAARRVRRRIRGG